VELSEPQIVDIAVYYKQTGGDATQGSDFTLDNSGSRVYIPAYRTSGTGSISIIRDEVPESTETFEITIGDSRTANATITPVTTKFTLQNYDYSSLNLNLDWSTPTLYDSDGVELGPTDVADLIFTLIQTSPDTVYDVSDGGGFESLTMTSDMPDDTYELRVSIYGVINTGDLGSDDYNIDLSMGYDQGGVQVGSIDIASALNTLTNCVQSDYVQIATITKSGSNYTINSSDLTSFAKDNTGAIATTYTEDTYYIDADGVVSYVDQVTNVTMTAPDANGLFTITNFGFEGSNWWCGQAGATLDLVLDGTSIVFPDGGTDTPQAVGGISDICGYSGPVVYLNEPGSWNPCTGEIQLSVEVTVDAGSFGNHTFVYTP